MALTPEEQADDVLIHEQGLHTRRPRVLRRMRRLVTDKIQQFRPISDELQDADGYRGRIYSYRYADLDAPLTRPDAVVMATEERDQLQAKLVKLIEHRRLMVVELDLRSRGEVDRTADYAGDDVGDDA
jgi:hypothetical protein